MTQGLLSRSLNGAAAASTYSFRAVASKGETASIRPLLLRWLPPLSQSESPSLRREALYIDPPESNKKQQQHNTGDNKRHGALLLFIVSRVSFFSLFSFLCCVHVWQHHLASLSHFPNIYSVRSRLCITHVIYYASDNDFFVLKKSPHFQLTISKRLTLTDATTLGSI